jgi:OOP family OmpA-OmpF porin
MSKLSKLALIIVVSALTSGCANQNIKPTQVICPVLGAVLGAGVVAGGLGGDDAGPMIGGAVVGAGLAYFLCQDRTPERKAKPAPRPAPKPAPKPIPPKDTDGDGVIDANDQCPDTTAGVKVNAVGCPEVGEVLMNLEGVNFDTNSANLRPESGAILDGAVAALNQNASVYVRIEGHTDNRGSAEHNKSLSQRRAQSVLTYLVSKGIDGGRLSAVGYGEATPIAANDSPENMFKNRRVALVVTES